MHLAAAFLLLCPPAAAVPEGPKVSTSTGIVRAVEATPWSLGMGYYPRERARFDITYRMRWDLDDLVDSPGTIGRGLLHPAGTLDSTFRGMLRGTRLDLYGLRVRPWKMLPRLQPAPAVDASSATAVAAGQPPPRPFITFDPLFDDLKESAQSGAERWLIREGFDRSVPSSRGRAYREKEEAARYLLEGGRSWGSELEPFLE